MLVASEDKQADEATKDTPPCDPKAAAGGSSSTSTKPPVQFSAFTIPHINHTVSNNHYYHLQWPDEVDDVRNGGEASRGVCSGRLGLRYASK